MPSYTDIAVLKGILGIENSFQDAHLTRVLNAVEAAVESQTGRIFGSAARTEYYDGTGQPELSLNFRPVTQIAGVWVDQTGAYGHNASAFGEATAWTVGEWFAPQRALGATRRQNGILIALRGAIAYQEPHLMTIPHYPSNVGLWPTGAGNVKVTYTAGYSTLPAELENELYELATRAWGFQRAGGREITSVRIGRYSETAKTTVDSLSEMVSESAVVQSYCSVAF